MSKVESGFNLADLIEPTQTAAQTLMTSTDGVCKVSVIGGFWVAKEGCEFSGDVVHTFAMAGQKFIIYEPDSSDS